MANINSVITYNANLSPAQAQIKALTAQVGALSAAFNTLDKSALSAQRSLASTFAANVGQIGGFTAQTVKANDAVTTFGKQIAANRLTMREYFREAFTGYARQNSMLRQLAVQQVRYQQSVAVPTGAGQAMLMTPQSISAASSAAQLASQRFSIFNQLVNGGATAMLNWGKNTQWAGRQLMVGFTVPLMLFTAVASKQIRELDKELTRFQKVYGSDLGGAITDSTQRMRDQVEQLAYDISRTYGIAAKDTAALAADIAATGAEGEKLMASVQQTTRLAVLGEVDRQEAMKATLSLQSAFRMNTNELAESINFLNAVENQTSATLEDLATAIPKVGPVVRSLGGDIKDLATLLVAMREGGIPAAEAANALKSGLASLINPTKQASEVAKQFGVDLVGIVNANRGQLMPTIYAMQDALNGLDSFSRSRIIEQIFGKYQFARITALFDNIGRTGSQTQQVVELASKSSAELAAVANGEIRTLTESTAVKFQRTLEDLKNSIMPIGQALTETLIPIFEFIGKGMGAFTSFFQALPEPIKNFAKYGVAIAALAGPVIMLVGLFGNLIANGIKFGMMITRLGARMAGIKTEKFELLNADVMAAKLGVDNLTQSFTNQETAMKRLVGVLSTYEQSLRRLSISNPALFIPGAVPARGPMPIKRQAGSTRPEFVPGSGRGDKIPAMLEPGEFIVNRRAAQQYAPVLLAMNRGNLPGFQDGTETYRGSEQRRFKASVGVPLALGPNAAAAGILRGFSGLQPSLQNLIGLFYKDIAKSIGVPISAITADFRKWQRDNKQLIDTFTREYALAAGDAAKQRALIKAIDDKYIKDMGGAKSSAGLFAMQAAEMEKENTAILKRAQQILVKHGVDLNDAAQVTQFYKQNLRDLSSITDKTELAAMKLLQSILTPGSYASLGKVLSATVPLTAMPGGAARTAASVSSRYQDIGIPQQYISPLVRNKAFEQRAFGAGFSREVQIYMRDMQLSVEHTATTLGQIGKGVANNLKNLTKKVAADAKQILGIRSPSSEVDAEARPIGVGIAQGAVNGLRKGMEQVLSRNPRIVPGPVGGTGIESISNAQKIAQADQSILRLKTLQQKFTADRVRAEVELGALDARLLQIRSSETMTAQEKLRAILALNQERIALEKVHQVALANETRIQNTINGYKQKIADADLAQLRAEQTEAQAAARRAAGSIGIGPGGASGWLMGGVSPYASRSSVDQFNKKIDAVKAQAGPSVPIGRGTSTGPSVALSTARDSAGTRGGGLMNAAFMASMAMSSVAMLGGASSDAAMKIGLFSTALMTATMLMQSVSAKGMFTNFLGMGSLGRGLTSRGAASIPAPFAPNLAGATAARGAGFAGAGSMGLLRAGSMFSMLGGPVGIAAGLGITGAIAGFMMYRNAADEARERAIAAFNDPVKSAEYFGETIMSVSDLLEKNRLSNISEDLGDIDKALREAVSQDYAPLIEQIKSLSAGAGAQQLSVAYSNMILSGMSAENAKAAVEAIAAEAGIAGGEAFNEAVSQGLLNELTTSEAVQRVVGQFNPGQAQYGNSGQSVLTMLTEDLAKLEERKQEIERLMSRGGRNQQLIAEYNSLSDQIDAIADRIEDLSTVNPDMISGVLDSLILAYQQDPTAAIDGIKQLSDTINSLEDEGDRVAALDKITEYLRDSYGEQWITVGQSIDTANEKLLATQMLAAGISLDRAVNSANEFDSALGQALVTAKLLADEAGRAAAELQTELTDEIVADLESQRADVETEIQNIEDANAKLIRGYNRRKRNAVEAFEAEQESRQENIESMQDEMDQRRRTFEEEIEQLDDRKEAIEKSSEAYIKSLEKNQKAESFYSQQRKTAFSALEKLASGDVFGFLQEREQMSADAQEFSYDQMISGIEERRDLELEAIDEVRKKKQDEQDEYEQMMEDRIKAEQDLMDEQQKAHDAQMEHYDKQIKKAEREKEQKITRKREEIEELNDMQETASRDILEFQKKYAEEYEKYDQYARQLENLKILRVQEIYFRGGVPLSVAANRAGIPASEVPGFLDRNRDEFAFQGTSPGGGGGLVIPSNSTVYISQELPAGPGGSQQVKDMTVSGDIIVNGDIVGSNSSGDRPTPPPGYTYDEQGNIVPIATGGYLKDGKVHLKENGGKVIGPGGPKSDVIPAMLSNGEYVIRASSVSKYGTELMHSINAGRFAEGGYISADRAEYAASKKPKYFGGTPTSTYGYTKPGPAYSGGTPTYSGGYTTTNRQAEGRGKKDRNNPYTRGGYSRGYNSGRAGEGFSLIGRGISESINQRGVWGMLSDMVSSITADPRSLIPFYGLGSINTSTQAGKDMLSAAALMEILGIIPGVGVPFKAISMAGRAGIRSALRPRTIAYAAGHTPLDPNEAAVKYFPDVFRAQTPVRGLYSPTKTDPLILDESPSSPFAQASVRDSYLENIFSQPKGGQGGISPGGWVIGKDGVERYVKTPQSGIPQAAYSEVLTAKLYERLGFNVPNMSLLRLGAEGRAYKLPTPIKYRSDPFADDPSMFKPGSLVISSDKLEFDPFGGSSAPEILAREQGFGTAMDQWLHFTDMHPGNYFFSQGKAYRMDFGSNPFYNPEGYPSSGKLFTNQSWIKVRKEYEGYPSISPSEISDQWRVLSNAIQNRGGLGKLIQLISSDIQETTGIQLSNQSRVVSLLEKRLREGLRLTENPENMSITTLPPRSFSGLYASGGLVQKFAEGGLVGALKKWMKPEQFELYDNWSGFGSSTKPTGIMMHHTAGLDSLDWVARTGRVQYGSSPGPVVSSYASRAGKAYILGKGPIPGWGAGQGSVENLRENFPELAKEIEKYGHASNSLWQVEAESLGSKQDFTSSQMDAVARMTAAIREYSGWNTFRGRIINHRDWAPGRKPDTLYPVSVFERNAEKVWGEGSGSTETTPGNNNQNRRGRVARQEETPNVGDSLQSSGGFGKAIARILGRQIIPTGRSDGGNGGGGGTPGGGSITLDPNDYKNKFIKGYDLVKLIYGTGWKNKDDVRTAYGIVMGESGGDRTGKNYNAGGAAPGSTDWGLWQINDFYHKTAGDDKEKVDFGPRIMDAIYNSRIAYKIAKSRENAQAFDGDQWGSWNAYRDKTTQYNLGLQTFDNNPNWWRQLVTQTGGSNNGGGGDNGGSPGTVPAARAAVNFIRAQVGDRYVTGAGGPDSWDCSNLTAAAWNHAAEKQVLSVPSSVQANQISKRVVGLKSGKISGVIPGDVLYFAPNGVGVLPGHTSMYVGNGNVVEASSPATGVRVSSLNNAWNTGVGKFKWAGPPKNLRSGGFISGPGGPRSDSIPAMLSNGEYVVKASSVAKYGKGFMDKLNNGSLNLGGGGPVLQFANGGMVGNTPMPAYDLPQVSSPSFGLTNNNFAGNSSSSTNRTNVKVVINGAGGKSANAIANKVISMINDANRRREHSRSV